MKTLNGMEELVPVLIRYKSVNVLMTFHSRGDIDSVSSAFALSEFFDRATIATSDTISQSAARILKRTGFGAETVDNKFPDGAQAVILLDANNFEECGGFRQKLESFNGPIIVIDHHAPNAIQMDNVYMFDDESFNSTASIVYELLKVLHVKLDRHTAKLLAAGVISDSAELKNATADTFVQIGELLNAAKIDYQELLDEIVHISDTGTRAEAIEDLMGATVVIREDTLFIFGMTHGRANIVADNAMRLGADVALFQSGGGKDVSFSARLRPPLDKRYGIHLGKLLKDLAPIIGGTGGGHPCAAGAYGSRAENAHEFIDEFNQRILDMVKSRK
jgi:nanoRNase/pAp phosphatase (c-di-AMP/oligoRNAs hydrolase)